MRIALLSGLGVVDHGLQTVGAERFPSGQGKPVTIGADDNVEELVRNMARNEVKRAPVIDGHSLVGVVSEAELAEHATPEQLVSVVRGVYGN